MIAPPTYQRREIHLFAGFLQDADLPTGTFRIWSTIYEQCAGPNCVVQMHAWDTNPRVLAQRIANSALGVNPARVDIVLGGYSFGGMTAALVAKQLRAVGHRVRKMVLCDPVYRHWYYAGWWRSLIPWSQITIPSNVSDVEYFLQRNPRFEIGRYGGIIQPAGHDVVPEFPDFYKPKIHEPTILECNHSAMDESTQYRDALISACRCSKDAKEIY